MYATATLVGFASALVLCGCSQKPTEACSRSEATQIHSLLVRAFTAGTRADQPGVETEIQQILIDGEALRASVSARCREFIDRLDATAEKQDNVAPRRPPPALNDKPVYYNAATDTYFVPDSGISCGPAGCLLP